MKSIILFLICSSVYATDCETVFTEIWKTNYWGGVSLSGTGSDLIQTEKVREALPRLLKKYNCKSLVDAPCGDFYWMQTVDLPIDRYFGVDVVGSMITLNQIQFGDRKHLFIHLDITKEVLPRVDLILCRDCLGHFSYEDILKTVKLFKESRATYLLTTSFTEDHPCLNSPIPTGEWRSLDLRKAPFNFPEPIEIINENCTVVENAWNDKSLFLWKLQDLP